MSNTSAHIRRYEVLDVLGRGGFGTVYRAELTGAGGFSKQVALKVLHGDTEGTTELVARLRDEARMLGLLRHRAIVRVDGLVRLEGRWAVVMEFVDGASCAELRDTVHVPVSVALALVSEVAAALNEAWTREVDGRPLRLLHRDVKPSNIKLSSDGTVKLLDFGIARANFRQREASTQATLFGSLPFMAPERLSLRDNDRSDVFALAITLVELLAGPQHTQPSAAPDHHARRVDTLVAALASRVDDDALAAFVRSCLALAPEARPDAAAFARTARQLGQRFPDLYLPDWASETVPSIGARRPAVSDPLLGRVLIEDIDGPGPPGPGNHNTFILSDSAELPARAPTPAPAHRPTSPSRHTRGCIGLLGGAIALGGLGAAAIAAGLLLAVVGLGAMALAVWPPLRDAAVEREFREMSTALAQVRDSSGKTRLRALLRTGAEQAYEGRVSMFEIVDFRLRFNDSLVDRVIDSAEVRVLERKVQLMLE